MPGAAADVDHAHFALGPGQLRDQQLVVALLRQRKVRDLELEVGVPEAVVKVIDVEQLLGQHQAELAAVHFFPHPPLLASRVPVQPQSALTFAARAIFENTATSSRISLSKASGDNGRGVKPMGSKRCRVSASLRMRTISRLSLATTGRGTPEAVSIPNHRIDSNPGTPVSATVGTAGSNGSRFAEDTASATSFPSLTRFTEFAIGAMKNCTRPVMVSVRDSGIPLNGTCTTSTAAMALNISAAKWVPLPTPAEEKFSWPGFALAAAIRSATDRRPSEGATTRT